MNLLAQWSDPSGAKPATIGDLEIVFENIVNAVLGFAGIVLFILLLIGGFKYITSGGDPKVVEGAKKTLTYAIGGMVAIALSYIVLLLIGQVTGVNNITLFRVVQP